ncbi:hypothetical protein [uncultured Methylobacterium sp.]|uniref:hypothetical protein n=1 Tax=uncultured Methylobacterium sp. TaxID=157278 RepID=UPI0025855F22|nr:hypothetical protein [uncultured Methylobacterium sp.]
MPDARIMTGHPPERRVSISNTASNMLSSLFPTSTAKVDAAFETIKADMADPAKVQKLAGFDDLYVARGHGIRVVFKQDGDDAVITAVAAEG